MRAVSEHPRLERARATTSQALSIELEGITAGDYLTWVRDPEPMALGSDLHSIEVSADPLGSIIDVELVWNGVTPSLPRRAASKAGLPTTADVRDVRERPASAWPRRSPAARFAPVHAHASASRREGPARRARCAR